MKEAGSKAASEILSLLLLRDWPNGTRTALSISEGARYRDIAYEELRSRAQSLSDYLIAQGCAQGDRVAILSDARPEWVIAFLAAIRAGATLVPLDPKLAPAEIYQILNDSEPRALFISSRFAEESLALQQSVPSIHDTILLDTSVPESPFPYFKELEQVPPTPGRERRPEETALLIYTSGTTGKPKGVMITFGNLIFQVSSLQERLEVEASDVFFSMLSLNHLLELTGGLCCVLYAGAEVCYGQTLLPGEILRIIGDKKVTKMVTVPLFLNLFKREFEKAEEKGESLRDRLGAQFKFFITGGAPLDPGVESFFLRRGVPVYQGYGMTECSPVITVNSPFGHRPGSAGKPLDGVEVRISEEGEIQTRGPHVMKGYYRREDLTRDVLDADGWLHTGDLGRLDEYLFVTGRIKNLIVLANGKKVQAEEVEDALARSALFKEVCVLASRAASGLLAGTEEVCAVVVPAEEFRARFSGHPDGLEESARAEVARLAATLAPHKRPSRILIRPEAFPRSVSNKVKRRLVATWVGQQRENAP